MLVILSQELIQSLGHRDRDVGLTALLTNIGRDIPDDDQLFTTPDFQRGLARLQFPPAQITTVNRGVYR